MQFRALCTDYDGTIAEHSFVGDHTRQALESFKAAGGKVILNTGRELHDFRNAFSPLELFDLMVLENGAVIYDPATQVSTRLATPAPQAFVDDLRERGVHGLYLGEVIVAVWMPHHDDIVSAIARHKLDWQVILNKGAVMALPRGVNKGTGLAAALEALKISAHDVIGFGDGENDHDLLNACGCGVAVANALDELKAAATYVTKGDHGYGVAETIARILNGEALPRRS